MGKRVENWENSGSVLEAHIFLPFCKKRLIYADNVIRSPTRLKLFQTLV